MKQIKIILLIAAGIFLFGSNSNAQCLPFVKSKGFEALDTAAYIPDGRLDAIPLSQGDNFEVYKSFFRGRKYKIVVVADDMPGITFTVKNFQRQTLFDSKKRNANEWEFVSAKNQNVIINVDIAIEKNGKPKTGCVAILVGYKSE